MTTTTDKIEKVYRVTDFERCYVSKSRGTIIDVIHPNTGKTVIYGKTLEECRAEAGYQDAEEMRVDEFCAWKAATQRTPIAWTPTTEEKYDEMLNVLPPALYLTGGFLVGEPWDHDAGQRTAALCGVSVPRRGV